MSKSYFNVGNRVQVKEGFFNEGQIGTVEDNSSGALVLVRWDTPYMGVTEGWYAKVSLAYYIKANSTV